MNCIKTPIDGVLIIEPRIFVDERGYFFESFSQREFDEKVRPITFVQDNESKSSYGVMRGLHFQRPPFTQSKLVRCVKGAVLDVAVDIRKGSPTYGQHVAVELTDDNHRQFFIPKGFAHGFAVLSETAVFQYKCDEFYHPEADGGISILDDSLGIDWKIKDKAILSEKAYQGCINKVKNKDFPTSLQTLGILIHTEDVEILDPRFGRIQMSALYHTFIAARPLVACKARTCQMRGMSVLKYFKSLFSEIAKGRTDYENMLPMTISLCKAA